MITPEHQQHLADLAGNIVTFVRHPDGAAFQIREYREAIQVSKCHSYMRDGMESARNNIRMLAEMVDPRYKKGYERIPMQERSTWLQRFLDWDPETDPNGLLLLESEAKIMEKQPVSSRHLGEAKQLEAATLRLAGYQVVLSHYQELSAKSPQG